MDILSMRVKTLGTRVNALKLACLLWAKKDLGTRDSLISKPRTQAINKQIMAWVRGFEIQESRVRTFGRQEMAWVLIFWWRETGPGTQFWETTITRKFDIFAFLSHFQAKNKIFNHRILLSKVHAIIYQNFIFGDTIPLKRHTIV